MSKTVDPAIRAQFELYVVISVHSIEVFLLKKVIMCSDQSKGLDQLLNILEFGQCCVRIKLREVEVMCRYVNAPRTGRDPTSV